MKTLTDFQIVKKALETINIVSVASMGDTELTEFRRAAWDCDSHMTAGNEFLTKHMLEALKFVKIMNVAEDDIVSIMKLSKAHQITVIKAA